ncbi:UNVERIFIED_CONTAM: murein DD-endopeptidase MepM/ murein hydrolase activator NlpD [Brevibacillus sp. OAP136]
MIPAMREYRASQTYGTQVNPATNQTTFHTGIDLVKPSYADIAAFAQGVVVFASYGQTGTGVGGYGNTVILRDRHDYLHMYAHLTDYRVKVGDQVLAGSVVGREGMTGQATGQHLHYEVRRDGPSFGYGQHTDPVLYMDQYFTTELKDPAHACGISYDGMLLPFIGGIVDGKSFLPVRALAEAVGKGAQVEWNNEIRLTGINGTELLSTFLLDAKAYAWSRELARVLGLDIRWDDKAKVVQLTMAP